MMKNERDCGKMIDNQVLSVGKIIYSDIWITQWGDVSMLGAVNYITPNINNQSWTLALSGSYYSFACSFFSFRKGVLSL